MSFLFRPRRTATLKTRLAAQQVLDRVRSEIARARWDAITGGEVGASEFRLGYHFAAHKNPQHYTIHGSIEDRGDWRFVRLTADADVPWIEPLLLAFCAGLAYLPYFLGGGSAKAGTVILTFVVALLAFVNILWVPDTVIRRVCRILIRDLQASYADP